MNKIHAITTGEYSDYDIVAAFSTKEKADHFKKVFFQDSSSYEVREFDFDPEIPEEVSKHNQSVFHCYIDLRSGDVERASLLYGQYGVSYNLPLPKLVRSKYSYEKREMDDSIPYLDLHMWATDQEHALKIASEIRAEYLAFPQLIKCSNKNCEQDTNILYLKGSQNKEIECNKCANARWKKEREELLKETVGPKEPDSDIRKFIGMSCGMQPPPENKSTATGPR